MQREPVHSSITPEQISSMVDQFYGKVLSNSQLAPIFQAHVSDGWNNHLDKMKSFWRSVLLRTGEYKGKPVPVHLKIDDIKTSDFREWVGLFSDTTRDCFTPDAAVLVNQAAQRIATSLWLSRSSDPFVTPPNWANSISSSPSNAPNGGTQ